MFHHVMGASGTSGHDGSRLQATTLQCHLRLQASDDGSRQLYGPNACKRKEEKVVDENYMPTLVFVPHSTTEEKVTF